MQNNKDMYKPHKAAIFALFILGETGILIPFKNGNDKIFLGFLIAVFLGPLILLLSNFCFKKIQNLKSTVFNKILKLLVFIALAAYSIYLAVNCFNVFINFVSLYVLPQISPFLSGAVFFAVVLFLALSKKESFYKLGLITAFFSSVMLIVLFIFSFPQFSLDNISLFSFPNIGEVSLQGFSYIKYAFLPIVIIPFFEEENKRSVGIFKGYLWGSFLLTVCILNSLLIFGNSLSSKLDFPYSEAIATVTAGNIFTRMDGFSYFIFFTSCLIKTCLCIKIFLRILKNTLKTIRQ